MKPIQAAFINPSGKEDLTHPERRVPLQLSEDDLISHIHGVGSTRSGKSKWLEWFCRELYRRYIGFTILDPQGAFSEDLLAWLCVKVPDTPVIYFDPNREDYVVPFNPFRPVEGDPSQPSYLTKVATQASRQRAAILRVWNAESAETTPRLARWLYVLFYVFARGLASFNDAARLLALEGSKERQRIIAALGPEEQSVADEWRDLESLSKRSTDFLNQIESVKNRLFSFVTQPRLKQIFSMEGLSLDQAFRDRAIVICNLKPGDALHEDETKILGALIINDLWSSVARYVRQPNETPYYLFIDEVQKFVTPDLKEILDRGAGKGLRLGVFHQHLDQLREQDPRTYASIVTNGKIKLAFGGLSYGDARTMVDEMFAGQLDLKEVKNQIEQTKFWPTYDREIVRSKSMGQTTGESQGQGFGEGFSNSSGIQFLSDTDAAEGRYSFNHGASASNFSSRGSHSASSESEGIADVPIYRPVPFTELSSTEFYSLEEQKERMAWAIMRQYQRHLFIRIPGMPTQPALTPFVSTQRLPPEREAEEITRQFVFPYGMPLEALAPSQSAEELPEPENDD
ncbi:MAG: TraM recognition domain-containing protein, partial [Trueperaceae bacterium]|nr:TraM recognition domain-containing protein [Trueperaceae bacterium]